MKKSFVVMVIVVLLITPYSLASVLNDSQAFLSYAIQDTNEIPDKAFMLLALSSIVGKTENTGDLISWVSDVTGELLNLQNPDGGWGHYPNSISTPQDTGIVLVALKSVSDVAGIYELDVDGNELRNAIKLGKNYLIEAFNGEAWGYVADSPSDFYPTAISLWALGELGLTVNDSLIIASAVDYLKNYRDERPEYLALRLIAFHSVGASVDPMDLERCKELLFKGELTNLERAMLTYALVLYEPFGFETAQALTKLEMIGNHNGTYYIVSREGPLLEMESMIPTSYAVLAFSKVADFLSQGYEYTPSAMCELFMESQNPDGGWGFPNLHVSSPKVTYYAIKGLEKCAPSSERINLAIEWARKRLDSEMENVRIKGTITEDYYYLVKILAETSSLTPEEKDELLNFTVSLSKDGLYTGYFSIPQPRETAWGLELLLLLGGDWQRIEKMKEWLLSITEDGWGIILNRNLNVMVGKNVPDTLTVLEALSKVSTVNELKEHVEWLLNQRLENGAWGYFKESTNMLGEISTGIPSFEYTVRAIYLLKGMGLEVPKETLSWVTENVGNAERNSLELSLAIEFLTDFRIIPPISLYDVVSRLENGVWQLCYPEDYNDVAETVERVLKDSGVILGAQNAECPGTNGNYIILADFGSINVSNYNLNVSVVKLGKLVRINGETYRADTTIAVIPGRTEDGYVLIVLFGKETETAVKAIFESGMFKYLHGKYLVLEAKDRDGNGSIDPYEIRLLDAG